MVTSKTRFLRYEEVWFDRLPMCKEADVVLYNQRSERPEKGPFREFYTMVIDLKETPGQILGRMSESTAYQARRARDKDKIQCESLNVKDAAVLRDFIAFFDCYARQKQSGSQILVKQLKQLAEAGLLDITVAKSPEGERLVYHALVHGERARLLHSVSNFRELQDSATRNYVSRANRYLHFWEFLHYKGLERTTYDFGGWYTGTVDQERLSINRFKLGFGGVVVKHYSFQRSASLSGTVVQGFMGLVSSVRNAQNLLRERVSSRRPEASPAEL